MRKEDMKVLSVLVQALFTSQAAYVINQTMMKEVWTKLEEVSRGRVLERRFSSRRKLNATKWEKGETATQYTHHLEATAGELHTLGGMLEDSKRASTGCKVSHEPTMEQQEALKPAP